MSKNLVIVRVIFQNLYFSNKHTNASCYSNSISVIVKHFYVILRKILVNNLHILDTYYICNICYSILKFVSNFFSVNNNHAHNRQATYSDLLERTRSSWSRWFSNWSTKNVCSRLDVLICRKYKTKVAYILGFKSFRLY